MTAASIRCALLLSLLLAPAFVRADERTESVAEALFREGMSLVDAGRIPEACAKFAESYRLDPANGTLQNLALCHAREGKVASAWAEFALLAGQAAQVGQRDRERMARAQVTALEARLSRLTLAFDAASNVSEVLVDDRALGRAAWTTPLPLDPGEHAVTFRAPGKRTATRAIRVPDQATAIRIDVPALEDEPARAPTVLLDPAHGEAPHAERSSLRPAAIVVGGAGLVAIGVGAYLGLRTIALKNDGDRHCTGAYCDSSGLASENDAHTTATWSTIAFGAGLGAIGVATLLWLASPSSAPASNARVRVVPGATARGASIALAFTTL